MIHSNSSSFDLRQTGSASAEMALPLNYLNPAAKCHGLNHTLYLPANSISGEITLKETCPIDVSQHIYLDNNLLSPWGRQVGPGAAGVPEALVPDSLLSLPQCATQ